MPGSCKGSNLCNQCQPGWFGPNCEFACLCRAHSRASLTTSLIDSCGPNCVSGSCTGHNTCSQCTVGFGGPNCDDHLSCGAGCIPGTCLTTTSCQGCKIGFIGHNCATELTCGQTCVPGACTGDDPNTCTKCLPGYFSPPTCSSTYTCSPRCASQSNCVADDHCNQCETGFTGPQCHQLNACTIHNGGCGPQSACTPIGPGLVKCACIKGFLSASHPPDGHNCFAINPCLKNNGGCGYGIKNVCYYVSPGKNTCSCAWPYHSPTGRNCLPCLLPSSGSHYIAGQ